MRKSLLHEWETDIVKNSFNVKNMLKIAEDIYNVAYIRGQNHTQEQRWIPVSERLPKESGDYLVTIKWKGSYSGDAYIEINMAEYRKKLKEWDCVDVIAWMPLPKPYEPQESEASE